ncbi:MAG: HTH domain-containing protein [Spirochaetes bacterium]|nr:HTH domain-containing protein [Spirochaetota bacterium]
MKKLHPTQKKLLEILKANLAEPLTIRELQEILHLSSTSLVHHHIQQLEKKGHLKRNPANSTDYQIINDSEKQITYLNLYGMAQCGPNGRLLDGNPIDRIPISTKILGASGENSFIVEAAGDSMIPKIHAGDLVVAQKTQHADDGTIVVCVNKGKAFIKKIVYQKEEVHLHSLNPAYPPFSADSQSFAIEGIVKSVLTYSF